jgi:hypothetical protein
MFVMAIDRAARFTRAIHFISRVWKSEKVIPGTATLFFVNSDGWALTCKHVVNELVASEHLSKQYDSFKAERFALVADSTKEQSIKDLQAKYGFTESSFIESRSSFVDCVDKFSDVEFKTHPSADLALLHFRNFNQLLCDTFPVFAKDNNSLSPGKFICRLGFPFPEFTNFEYDASADAICWTKNGRQDTPRFPLEGMVTRYIGSSMSNIEAFEVSTPGLRGQSGGPAFDADARIWGMQSATNHLDLDFDVDVEVIRSGKKQRVMDSAFLHVGHCVHVGILKQFMRDNAVAFQEG